MLLQNLSIVFALFLASAASSALPAPLQPDTLNSTAAMSSHLKPLRKPALGGTSALTACAAPTHTRSSTNSSSAKKPPPQPERLYFAFGSNCWEDQMRRRCPESQFRGLAQLPEWQWMINERGYANVVPKADWVVFGSLWSISAADERELDNYEGVPVAYEKEVLAVERLEWATVGSSAVQELRGTDRVEALVYVDRRRTGYGTPSDEYRRRILSGMYDMADRGMQWRDLMRQTGFWRFGTTDGREEGVEYHLRMLDAAMGS